MEIRRLIQLLQAATTLYVASINSSVCATAAQRPRVDGGVHRTLRRQATVNLMVTMKDDTTQVLESVHQKEASFASRGEMISHMVSQLERHATTSQQEITTLLAHESTASELASEVRSFWISNQLFFRDATLALVEKLSAMPSVAAIDEETVFPAPSFAPATTNSTVFEAATVSTTASVAWGVAKIQAPDVWATGNTGQGVVIGSIDSGVRATHESLRGNFRKEFGWFDPETKAAEPYDVSGHGTHTMATIAGADGVGVAPGVTWITCKGLRADDGYQQSDVLACAQFMMCPTDPTGTKRDCSKAPRLVNNSWGGEGGQSVFTASAIAWQRAGIIPIFAMGNYGPSCGTIGSPADLPYVIAVGSTDAADGLAPTSSKGPSKVKQIKPEVTAPGESVLSASWRSDTGYVVRSGTSMAAPHVTGVVALLLSKEPTLTYAQIRQRLVQTTDQATLKPADQACGGTVNGRFPNNMYGYGRVNALSALNGKRAPPPAPTSEPTSAPPRVAGECSGRDASICEATFFCGWNERGQRCQRWWS